MRIVKKLYGVPRFFWVVMLGVAFIVSGPPSELAAQAPPSTPQQQTFSAPFLNQPGGASGITSFQQNLSPDGIVNGIQSASNSWVGVLSAMATRLFFLLVIIDFAWMVMQWILQGRENTGEFLGQWIVKLIGVNIVYFLVLVHGWELSQIIINSILMAGSGLAGLNGAEVRPQNFLGIAATGVGIATPMLVQAVIYALIPNVAIVGWTNLQLPLLWTELFGATAVIGAYVLMAGSILLVWVEMYIATSIGVLMLGFSGSRWTQGFGWEKYLSLTLSLGIKMLMTYVCVDLALSVGNTIIAPAMVPGIGAIYAGFIASIMSLIVYNIPAFASSLMTGASNSGAGQAMSFATSTAGALTSAMQSMVQSMERVAEAIQSNNSQESTKETSTQTTGAVQYAQLPGQLAPETPQAVATELGMQEREMDYAAIGNTSGSAGGAPTGWTDMLANQFGPGGNGNDGMRGQDGRDGMTPPPPAVTALEQELERDREPLPAGAGFVDLGNGKGAFVADNGTVMLPDGSLVLPNGMVRMEDGSYVSGNGTVQYPDGTIVTPNGVTFDAEGKAFTGDKAPAEMMAVEATRYEAAIARAEAASALDRMGTAGPVSDAEMGSGRAPLPTNAQVEMMDRLEQARQAEVRSGVNENSSFGTIGQYANEFNAARDPALSSSSMAEPSAEFLARTAELQRENGATFSAPGLEGVLTGNSRPMEPVYASPIGAGASNNGMSMNEARVDSASLEAETRRIEQGLGYGSMAEPMSNEFATTSSRPMEAVSAGSSASTSLNEARTDLGAFNGETGRVAPGLDSSSMGTGSPNEFATSRGDAAIGAAFAGSSASAPGGLSNDARVDALSAPYMPNESAMRGDSGAALTNGSSFAERAAMNEPRAETPSVGADVTRDQPANSAPFAASSDAAEMIGASGRPMDAMSSASTAGSMPNDVRAEAFATPYAPSESAMRVDAGSSSTNGSSFNERAAMNEPRTETPSIGADEIRNEAVGGAAFAASLGAAELLGASSRPMDAMPSSTNMPFTNGANSAESIAANEPRVETPFIGSDANRTEAATNGALAGSIGGAEMIGASARPMDAVPASPTESGLPSDVRAEALSTPYTSNEAAMRSEAGAAFTNGSSFSDRILTNESRVETSSFGAENNRAEANGGAAFGAAYGAAEVAGSSARPMEPVPSPTNGSASQREVDTQGLSADFAPSESVSRSDASAAVTNGSSSAERVSSEVRLENPSIAAEPNHTESLGTTAFAASTGAAEMVGASPRPMDAMPSATNAIGSSSELRAETLSAPSSPSESTRSEAGAAFTNGFATPERFSNEPRVEHSSINGDVSGANFNGSAVSASVGAGEMLGASARPADAMPSASNGTGSASDVRAETSSAPYAPPEPIDATAAFANGSNSPERTLANESRLEAGRSDNADRPAAGQSDLIRSSDTAPGTNSAATDQASFNASNISATETSAQGGRSPQPLEAAAVMAPPSAASISSEPTARFDGGVADSPIGARIETPSAVTTSRTPTITDSDGPEGERSRADAAFASASIPEPVAPRRDDSLLGASTSALDAAPLEEKRPSNIFGRLVDSVLGRQPEKETVRETIRETVVREKAEMDAPSIRGTNTPLPVNAPDAETPAPYDPNASQAFAQTVGPMPTLSDSDQRKTIFDDDRLRKRDETDKRGES